MLLPLLQSRWRLLVLVYLVASVVMPVALVELSRPRRVTVAVVASVTGQYNALRPAWIKGIKDNFCRGATDGVDYRIFLWTDDATAEPELKVTYMETRHRDWPYSSLGRYNSYVSSEKRLASFDYVLAIDIDIRMVQPACREMLSHRTAVLQPFLQGTDPGAWPLERNPASAAAVLEREALSGYFTGAFMLAESAEFLRICRACIEMVERDAAAGVMPVWHDESYWNKYLSLHAPTLVLPGLYLYPEPPADLIMLRVRPQLWLDDERVHRRRPPVFLHLRKRKSTADFRLAANAGLSGEDRVCAEMTTVVFARDREECLQVLLLSLYARYPCMHVVVVDRSQPTYHSYIVDGNDLLTHLVVDPQQHQPAATWERVLQIVKTRHVFVVEENSVLPPTFKLESFLDALAKHPAAASVSPSRGSADERTPVACFAVKSAGRCFVAPVERIQAGRVVGSPYHCLDKSMMRQLATSC